MEEKEKFADNAEFQGAGVPPAAKEETPEPAEAGEDTPQADTAADETGSQEETPEAEAPKEEAAKPEEAKPDPLDIPIEDWAKVDLGLNDAPVDKTVMEAFGKTCIDLKLTPRQATALARFQLQAVEEARQRFASEALQTLRKEWGANADANQQKVKTLVEKVDKALGNERFTRALNESGAVCYSEVVNGLLAITEMLGEDKLGKVTNSQCAPKPESELEGLQDVFAAVRR